MDLPDDDADVVHAMLSYMYTLDYDDAASEEGGPTPLMLNVLVCIVADKYNMPTLAQKAVSKFRAQADKAWDEEGIAATVKIIYDLDIGSKQQLRDVVIDTCTMHSKEIFDPENNGGLVSQLARVVPCFGGDLAASLATSLNKPGSMIAMTERRYKCKDCPYGMSFVSEDIGSGRCGTHVSCPHCAKRKYFHSWVQDEV